MRKNHEFRQPQLDFDESILFHFPKTVIKKAIHEELPFVFLFIG